MIVIPQRMLYDSIAEDPLLLSNSRSFLKTILFDDGTDQLSYHDAWTA